METIRKLIPHFEPPLLERLESEGFLRKFEAGSYLLKQGSYVPGLPIVVSGKVKVLREGEDKDFLLYYVHEGESCIMSFSGCIHQQTSEVAAIVEIPSEVLIIPAEKLPHWLREFPSLNRFVMDLYQKRYLDLLNTLDQLVFYKLEDRILKYLERQLEGSDMDIVSTTHLNIATDLGSSREVITRVLKKLEVAGKIEQSNQGIRLKSP